MSNDGQQEVHNLITTLQSSYYPHQNNDTTTNPEIAKIMVHQETLSLKENCLANSNNHLEAQNNQRALSK